MGEKEQKSILYVEDEPAYVELFTRILRAAEVQVHTARNGSEGVEIFENLTPFLVFMDIRMPGIPGYVALRRIKKFAKDNQIPVKVVMLTSQNTKEDVARALSYGADDYLLKPFSRESLFEKIRKFMPEVKINEVHQEEM